MENELKLNVNFTSFDGFLRYLNSIQWSEPWIVGVMLFHFSIFSIILITRNHSNVQAVVFLLLLFLVYFSTQINQFANEHWTEFSRKQYFDNEGLFISIVFNIPILLNCSLMVSNWLYASAQLMRYLKIAQLKEQQEKNKNNLDEKND